MVKSIRIRSTRDIEAINRVVCRYPYDIWIHSKSGMADAKSILGMFILKLNEPLTLVLPDNVDTSGLLKELDEFLMIDYTE